MITHFGYFCLLVYVAGQTHLNSDATIADEGRPQGGSSLGVMPRRASTRGAPTCLTSRRFALGRAPTRGAPTDCFSRRFALRRAPTRGAPTYCLLSALCPGEGTHKGPTRGAPTDCVLPWGRAAPIRPHIHGWQDKRRIGWNRRMSLPPDNRIIYRSPYSQIQTERLSPSHCR